MSATPNTTLPELKATALSFGVDISAKASTPRGHVNYSDDYSVVETCAGVMQAFARLSPRNRYLLARAIFVMFDIAAEVPPEDK